MSDDDLKKLILSRRARCVAAALAATGLASCSPTPCLDVVVPPSDAASDAPSDAAKDAPTDGPQVCLAPIQEDSGADAGDGSPSDAGTG